jgi:hypothetical protein
MIAFDSNSAMAVDEHAYTHRFKIIGGEEQLHDLIKGPSRVWIDPEILRLYLEKDGETHTYAIEYAEAN